MTTESTGQRLAADIGALLRARASLIWVQTTEEMRVKLALAAAVEAATSEKQGKYEIREWNCVAGVRRLDGKEAPPGADGADPMALLKYVATTKVKAVWLLCDFPWCLKDPMVLRAVRNLAMDLPKEKLEDARTLVIISPTAEIPPELADHAVVVKWALPDRGEIATILDGVLSVLPPNVRAEAAPNGTREAAIEAAVGLSAEMAASCYKRSLVTQRAKIVPALVATEKKRVINREKGIEWYDADPRGLDAVGGLENLKAWLMLRRSAFSQAARDFGLVQPKGVLIVGPPGGGKSATAKAIASAWGVPLLKMDLGGMKSKFVGESEASIRASLAVVDAVGNCVVWLDEVEKSLANASGALDGGVSSDALGVLLTWMQDKKGGSFVVATANDVAALPPELLRKGRFDEIFAVDLPTQKERAAILTVALKQANRELSPADVGLVAQQCAGFVGAEIASIVPAALFVAFSEGARALTAADLVAAANTVVPLAKTAAEKITALREWAKGRARPASLPEVTEQASVGVTLDFDSN
jgi:AAA+ superfamily predicted ATPase